MNYDTMTDRELDALIAERVMGATRDADGFYEWPNSQYASYEAPDYTSNIRMAFEVVEAMRERGWYFSCIVAKDWISAAFVLEEEGHDPKASEEFADTLPRAICLAALRATDGL